MLCQRFIHTAVLFFVVGVSLGVYMGLTGNFTLLPVHAHINLLGWVSMALIGLLYAHYPHLQRGRLPKLQYWLHLTGLVLMMSGLALLKTMNDTSFLFMVITGSGMLIAAVLLLAYLVTARLRIECAG